MPHQDATFNQLRNAINHAFVKAVWLFISATYLHQIAIFTRYMIKRQYLWHLFGKFNELLIPAAIMLLRLDSV
jgi:hypothetical protein